MAPSEAQHAQRHETTVTPTTPNQENVDKVGMVAHNVADDIVRWAVAITKGDQMPTCRDEYSRTMRRTVHEMSTRHQIVFSSMMTRLNLTRECLRNAFKNIADEIFSDGGYNWGRIVTLYAFGACLAQHWVQNQEANTDEIAEVVGDYVDKHLSGWILTQKGYWDAFVEYFPEPTNTEDTMRKGLMWTMAFGLGALGILAAVR